LAEGLGRGFGLVAGGLFAGVLVVRVFVAPAAGVLEVADVSWDCATVPFAASAERGASAMETLRATANNCVPVVIAELRARLGAKATFIPPLYDGFGRQTHSSTTNVNGDVPQPEWIAWFPAPRSSKLVVQVPTLLESQLGFGSRQLLIEPPPEVRPNVNRFSTGHNDFRNLPPCRPSNR
jgi:hypothetical protein